MARPAAGSEMSIDELRARRPRAISGNGLDHGLLAHGEADECVRRCGFAVHGCRCACMCRERDERAGQRAGHRPPHIRAGVHIFSQCGTTTGSLPGYEHRATYRAKLHSEKSSSIGHNRQQ